MNRDMMRFGAPIAYVVLIFIGFAVGAVFGVVVTVLGAIAMGVLYTFANPGSPFERRRQ